MLTKNKLDPIVFKDIVNSKIRNDYNNSKSLKNILSKYDYSDIKSKQKFWVNINKVRSKINNILNWFVWKLISEKLKDDIDLKINSTYREFYSKARDVLKNQKITQKEINSKKEYMGLCLVNMLSKDIKLSSLDNNEVELMLLYLTANFWSNYDLDKILLLVNHFYPDDNNKKYELVFNTVRSLSNKWNNEANFWWFRDYKLIFKLLDEFNLPDVEKNLSIVCSIVSSREWDVDFSSLNFDLIKSSPYFENLLVLLDSFDHLYSIAPFFDKFTHLDEKNRYDYALKIAPRWSIFTKNLEKFNITNQQYLLHLAKISSWVELIWENNWSNVNFFNYEYKFDQDFIDFRNSIYNSVSHYSKLIYEDFWVSSDKKLSFLCEYIMQHTVFDECNLDWFLKIISEKFNKDFEKNFNQLAFWLSKNSNLNRVFSRIDLISEGKQELILKMKKTIIKYLVFNKWVVKTLTQLTTIPKSENDTLWFFLKKDIEMFLEFLLEFKYISNDVYKAILSENESFENIKNYIINIFSNSNWEPILKESDDFWIFKRNKYKVLSREIFFWPLNINFPKNNNIYDSNKIQEFYIYLFNCKNYFTKEFFDKLNISKDLFLEENFELLHNFFKNLNILINLEIIFLWSERFIYKDALKKLNISEIFDLIWEENHYFNWLNFLDLDIKNIKNFNLILSNLTKKIFVSKLDTLNLTSQEFDNFLKKWGKIDSILLLISNKESNKELIQILSKIILNDAKNNFSNYKYYWHDEDSNDIYLANKQIWFLDNSQKEKWINDSFLFTHYDPNLEKNNSVFEENLSLKIKKSLIDNKHLDEISVNYSNHIDNLVISLNDSNFLNDLKKVTKNTELLEKYSNYSDQKILDLSFYWLINAKNNEEIKIIINFIKRFSKKSSISLWNILSELNSFLKIVSSTEKVIQKPSFIFTTETCNPKLLLEIWWIVPQDYSCQNIKNNSSQLVALPWYVVDAWVKAIISFEIWFEYFWSFKEYNNFKNLIDSWDYFLSFNHYKLELKVGKYVFKFNYAIHRNILKIWREDYDKKPCLYAERSYSSLPTNSNKKRFVNDLHIQILRDKIDVLKWKSAWVDSTFSASRNPFWIYVDANNWIEKYEYKLKNTI